MSECTRQGEEGSTRVAGAGGVLLDVRELSTEFVGRPQTIFGRAVRTRAVDGVTLSIARGETLGVVGESGCGKTTLGRSILRLVEPCAGSVVLDGVDVLAASKRDLRRLRRDMQIVFQDPNGSLDPRMTVGQSVEEPLVAHGVGNRGQRRERVGELFEKVGLPRSFLQRYPHELSGGQKQRACLARALALSPKLIICDEAVSALDVSVQAQILNLLAQVQREMGLTYLFISHNLAVVRHISDRVAVMHSGKIVEMGDAEELYQRPQHAYTRALLAAVPGVRELVTGR